jgi:hypothetical protein
MSFLTGLLQTTGLSLALMTATIVGVHAADSTDIVTVVGADGAPGIGDPFPNVIAGSGQPATAVAAANSGTGNATASASATGGNGGITYGQGIDVPGGDASASSTATTTGSGGASSSANATGGNYGIGGAGSNIGYGGNATATADALATGGGPAFATASATMGESDFSGFPQPIVAANATSNAQTTNGAMAEARSSISSPGPLTGTGAATAKTSLGGVSVQSNATTKYFFGDSATVEALAQVGGSGPTALDPGLSTGAISIALPDRAYATTLIDGASNVADALLRPGYEILGIEILGGYDVSATIDFSFRGDLILGDISDNSVSNLGFGGPDSGLTISDTFGIFVIGGAVPELSTWAMMAIGFAGLGLVGYRRARGPRGALSLATTPASPSLGRCLLPMCFPMPFLGRTRKSIVIYLVDLKGIFGVPERT